MSGPDSFQAQLLTVTPYNNYKIKRWMNEQSNNGSIILEMVVMDQCKKLITRERISNKAERATVEI